jgi:DNA polymerase III delta prime subunit
MDHNPKDILGNSFETNCFLVAFAPVAIESIAKVLRMVAEQLLVNGECLLCVIRTVTVQLEDERGEALR